MMIDLLRLIPEKKSLYVAIMTTASSGGIRMALKGPNAGPPKRRCRKPLLLAYRLKRPINFFCFPSGLLSLLAYVFLNIFFCDAAYRHHIVPSCPETSIPLVSHLRVLVVLTSLSGIP